MKKNKQPPVEWSDEWIYEQAKKHNLKVGYVQIGRPIDNPHLIDDYIHLTKKQKRG